MKNNLLERIIKNTLLEYSIPVKADILVGSDQSDYEAAGAIAGFNIRVIAKKFKGVRPSESQLFKSINNVIQQDVDFEKIGLRNIANRGGMVALISGDLRASARNYSFRVWFFDEQYWKYQTMMLPLNEKGQILSTPTELGVPVKPGETERVITYGYAMYLGKAGIRFFKNGKDYANLDWISDSLKKKDTLDLDGLRKYEAWYNKLKKINATLPTEEFKMPDIDKLPVYGEIDNNIYIVDEEPESRFTMSDSNTDASFAFPEKLENEEIQIKQYIGQTNKKQVKVLFTGDILDSSYDADAKIEYVGALTDPVTGNQFFIGTIQAKIQKIDESGWTGYYSIRMGSLTNYKFWEGETGKQKDYVVNGAVKDFEIDDSSTITDLDGKTMTWGQYEAKYEK